MVAATSTVCTAGSNDHEVEFYPFDILSDGEDLRNLPLSMRKTKVIRDS